MSETLLLELGTEDLPARYVLPLRDALAAGLKDGLAKRGVAHGAVREFATPRRIAVLIEDVAGRQPDQAVERKGPQLAAAFKDGQPTSAALGFAKSCGVELAKLKKENGQLVFRKKQKGRRTPELIAEIFEDTLKQMDQLVPKRMRWGGGEETFVRPVQWLAALYGTRVLPLARFGLKAGRKTYGHRFHAPKAIALKTPADYAAALLAAKVQADFTVRRAEIRRQVEAEAAKLGGTARISEELLDEVTALVEWPVAISGRIEERFLELPKEVVVATVETNQRYFTVFDAAEKLLPYFITVANIESNDMAQVIAGNERVVRPRLTDALFFWEQDLKQPLAVYGEKLATLTFQKDLGSVADKVARVGKLAGTIAPAAGQAAALCKNDLVTRMVYEFPELQGLMGGYYARAAGLPDGVAQAIAEHYRPTQAGGPIPATREGQAVALADKLDTLAGIFRIGQKPTASKDPFALRRAALGALRIAVEGGLDLDLQALARAAWDGHAAPAAKDASFEDLWAFIVERLRGYAAERGATPERFEAVKSLGIAKPLDAVRRLDALKSFVSTPAAASLAAAGKRARNILRQASGVVATIDSSRLEHPAERALAEALAGTETRLQGLRAQADYAAMLATLSTLKEPVDAFFEGVMVMAEDPALRANRLALLAKLDALCREVADLSCLPG
jgi:glycyl-tRNA synthetase beta chain